MTDYLTIAGAEIDLVASEAALDRCTVFSRGGIPELTFSRIVGKLTALPDAWSGQSCQWSHGASYPGTVYFSGYVVGYTDRLDRDYGWIRDYRALGLRNCADYVPVTDSDTLSDSVQFNMAPNAISSIPSRMGRTVGQAVLDLLSMSQNAAALTAQGVGNYSSSGSGGMATAVLVNTLSGYGSISGLDLVSGGSGYSTAPTVVIAGPCTTQAVFTANVAGGVITSFSLVSAGSGYQTAPAVLISTLPAATITDLEALTIISPFPLSFCGERILQSAESVVQSCHPNFWLYVDVTGTIRFLDQRAATNYTVTLGNPSSTAEPDGTFGNRWLMPQLHRDHSDSYSRLVIRGDIDVTGLYLSVLPQADGNMNATYTGSLEAGSVATGGLIPDFAFGAYALNSDAAAHWSPGNFTVQSLEGGQDQGSCTCPSTTQVVITSSNTALTLAVDQLDQTSTGLHAILTVTQQIGAGSSQMFSTAVIANTAMTAGGSSTLTVAAPLPSTAYTSYFLTFSNLAGNVVWRRYLAVDPAIGAALQNYFPYPFAYRNYDGTAAAMTSAATGMVLWSASGAAPYTESDFSVTVDPSTGTISFPRPTSLVYGGGVVTPPSNIMVFVPVASGDLTMSAPSGGGFAGTLYTVEGIERTKTITLRDWTQLSGANTNIQTFANDQFDSIKDVVVEGSIDYLGLATTYLTPGASVSITGSGYVTGWETLQTPPMPPGLPVSSAEVIFQYGPQGTSYITSLQLSNRKQRYTGDVFIRPAVTGQAFGGDFGEAHGPAWADAAAGLGSYGQSEASSLTGHLGDMGGAAAGAAGQFGAVGAPAPAPAAGDRGGGDQADPAELEQVHPAAEPAAPAPEVVRMPTRPEAGLGGGS